MRSCEFVRRSAPNVGPRFETRSLGGRTPTAHLPARVCTGLVSERRAWGEAPGRALRDEISPNYRTIAATPTAIPSSHRPIIALPALTSRTWLLCRGFGGGFIGGGYVLFNFDLSDGADQPAIAN